MANGYNLLGNSQEPTQSWGSWILDGAYALAKSTVKSAAATTVGTFVHDAVAAGYTGEFAPFNHETGMGFSIPAGISFFGLQVAEMIIKKLQTNAAYQSLPGAAKGVVDVSTLFVFGMGGFMAGQALTGETDPSVFIGDLKKLAAVLIATFGTGRTLQAYLPPMVKDTNGQEHFSARNVAIVSTTQLGMLFVSGIGVQYPQGVPLSATIPPISAFSSMLTTATLIDGVPAELAERNRARAIPEDRQALVERRSSSADEGQQAPATAITVGAVNLQQGGSTAGQADTREQDR